MSTFTGYPTSYDSSDYSWNSSQNMSNGYTPQGDSTYCTVYLTKGRGAITYFYYIFDTSNIPSDATIDSVGCDARASSSNRTSTNIATREMQLFSGSTAKGSPTTFGTNATSTLDVGTWTRAELSNAKIRIYGVRGTRNVETDYYFRFYGATLTVDYTEVSTGNKVHIKVNGSWAEAEDIYVKDNGTWKLVDSTYKKINGAWVKQNDNSAMFDSNAIYEKA